MRRCSSPGGGGRPRRPTPFGPGRAACSRSRATCGSRQAFRRLQQPAACAAGVQPVAAGLHLLRRLLRIPPHPVRGERLRPPRPGLATPPPPRPSTGSGQACARLRSDRRRTPSTPGSEGRGWSGANQPRTQRDALRVSSAQAMCEGMSRAVGRVLSRAAVAGRAVTVIHLGWPLPTTSSALPVCSGGPPSNAHCLGLLRMGFTEPTWSPRPLVVSYTTVSPLPLPRFAPVERRSVLCGTVPRVTPGGCWPPSCPSEPGLSSTWLPTTRPSDRLVRRQCRGAQARARTTFRRRRRRSRAGPRPPSEPPGRRNPGQDRHVEELDVQPFSAWSTTTARGSRPPRP